MMMSSFMVMNMMKKQQKRHHPNHSLKDNKNNKQDPKLEVDDLAPCRATNIINVKRPTGTTLDMKHSSNVSISF